MKAKKVALWGILGALAVTVSFLEGLFDISFLPPGAQPGLSNIVTVFSIFVGGFPAAVYITLIKALLAFVTRGATAFLLSLAGGLASATATVLLLKMRRCPFSIIGISVIGAIIHNMSQLICASVLAKTPSLIYYAPVLLGFALISGAVTGFCLKALKPYSDKIKEKKSCEKRL